MGINTRNPGTVVDLYTNGTLSFGKVIDAADATHSAPAPSDGAHAALLKVTVTGVTTALVGSTKAGSTSSLAASDSDDFVH